jgi:penicillin-binding protein 1B
MPTPPVSPRPAASGRGIKLRVRRSRRPWLRRILFGLAIAASLTLIVGSYFWIRVAHQIDARLAGEARPIPRIYGRPFEIFAGRGLSPAEFVQRLNDVGYTQRPKAEQAGEFAIAANAVTLVTRPADKSPARTVRVEFSTGALPVIRRMIELPGNKPAPQVTLEAPLLAAIAPGEKRRKVPFATIPEHMRQAVLAIEDRRFYEHPGVDPIRMVGALMNNVRGNKKYLEGASTITQQIIKNTFLTPAQTPTRKLQEQFMALVLDFRYTKDQIFELYLNEIVLGQRGPFAIHGVGEASRIFFGKDVSNVSLSEAATLAGIIQAPSAFNPFRNPNSARDRRNVVLTSMAEAGFITQAAAKTAEAEPLKIAPRALENEAPYFVDYVSKLVDEAHEGLMASSGGVDVYTTLDLHMQRIAQEAVAEGLVDLDKKLSKRKQGQPQVALIAVDPRNGDILAYVGGRGYNETQFNRVTTMRRQPGSTFKPFVYLAAFEKAMDDPSTALTPATVIVDEPTVFKDGDKDYAPANYKDDYGGPVTLRQALAHSRNIVAIKTAEATGFDRVASFWKRFGVGTPALGVPSIALGVFEASPLEIATAYTIFTNAGSMRQLSPISRIVVGGKTTATKPVALKPIARPEPTYLVTNMMRSVINEGTAAQIRTAGVTVDLAGKTGTTNDQRDAWFVGFTPELLTVVWVGFDNNQPIGLTGAQAALPVWLSFTKRALSGRPSIPFAQPEGLVSVEIDRDTGGLATPACPRTIMETFLPGTEPKEHCTVHGGAVVGGLFRIGDWLKRIIRR